MKRCGIQCISKLSYSVIRLSKHEKEPNRENFSFEKDRQTDVQMETVHLLSCTFVAKNISVN